MIDAFLTWLGDLIFELAAPIVVRLYGWYAGLPSDTTAWGTL